jgi:hypothetical protein
VLEDALQQHDNMAYAKEKIRTGGSGEIECLVGLKPKTSKWSLRTKRLLRRYTGSFAGQ